MLCQIGTKIHQVLLNDRQKENVWQAIDADVVQILAEPIDGLTVKI